MTNESKWKLSENDKWLLTQNDILLEGTIDPLLHITDMTCISLTLTQLTSWASCSS